MLKVRDFLQDTKIYQSENRSKEPKISVIMPIYCHNGKLLNRAITSVLSQTFVDFEFIIVDDGSRDGSLQTALSYMEKDDRIVVIEHKYNSGLPAIRVNEGIMESRGKYIAYQFDDDEYLPHCLQTLYDEIEKHNELCVVYGNSSLTYTINGEKQERLLGGKFNYALLNGQNQIANNTVLHHKSICNIVGMYDPNIILRRYCDYDLWLRMGRRFSFYNVDETITNVYAAKDGSLGKEVKISNLGLIRRFVEIDRDIMLTPNEVLNLEIDNLNQYGIKYTQSEIDFLYRRDIFPFLNKNTYYLTKEQKQTYAISRSKQKNTIVTKSDYSTSIDVTIKNFLIRTTNIPYTYTFSAEREISLIEKENVDLVIFYRSISAFADKYMDKCKEYNIPSTYFMDDNMFKFYEHGTADYLAPNTNGMKMLEKLVKRSDLIVSYSPIITQDCKIHNKKVFELRTNIPSKYLNKRKREDFSGNKIKFAVFSGIARNKVFKNLWSALEKISQEYHDKISITFWGINPSDFIPLSCEVHYKEFTHSYELYLKSMTENTFNYQICPLESVIDAEKSKSPVKYLEGTITGAVGIFSNNAPYDKIKHNCCFKSEENTVDSWYKVLKNAINISEEERYAVYENAFEDIKNNWTSESQAVEFLTGLDAACLINNLKGKKIAYFMHESFLGGATLHLLRHALLMRSLGIQVLLCLPENQKQIDEFPNYIKKYGMTVNYLPCRRSVSPINRSNNDFLDAKVIQKWAMENNVGMFHSALMFPAVGIVAENMCIPNVATLHQYYENKNEVFKKDDCNIQVIHSSSNRYADEWQKVLGIPTFRIVCPVDDLFFDMYEENFEFNTKSILEKKSIDIIVSGTVQERKNQLGAINAIKILRDKGYNVNLNIVGYDTLLIDYVNTCKERIVELGISEYVHFEGFTNTPEIYYNKNCQILLCSASNESMPQTILQAMAAGLFVISTNCGGVTEIVKNNYNGIIADRVEDEEIANAIERLLLLDIKKLEFILSNARDTISAIADKNFVRSELLNLYNMGFDYLNKIRKPIGTVSSKSVESTTTDSKKIENITTDSKKVENVATDDKRMQNVTALIKKDLIIPLSNKEGYTEIMGGRNLTNRTRKYNIAMRTGELIGIKFLVATNGEKCNGELKAKLYCKNQLLEAKIFQVKEYEEIKWEFTSISCNSGDILELVLTYIPDKPGEWVCIYEKRKPLNFINRILYKLNAKSSYEIEGNGIFR